MSSGPTALAIAPQEKIGNFSRVIDWELAGFNLLKDGKSATRHRERMSTTVTGALWPSAHVDP